VRQLRIYAYLLHEATGQWAKRGILYPIAGPPVVVDLDASACRNEAEESVALLDRYNAEAAKAQDPAALASPSPEACRWCPFKVLCPAFWAAADESWAGALDGEAAVGRLQTLPQSIHGGSAHALSLVVEAGTVPRVTMLLTPFPGAIHGVAAGLSLTDRLRVVGLGRRENGTVFPAMRTVVLPESALPVIAMCK